MYEIKFKRSLYDVCVYYRETKGNDFIYLLHYVDDIYLPRYMITFVYKI